MRENASAWSAIGRATRRMIRLHHATTWCARSAYGWRVLLDQSRLVLWQDRPTPAAPGPGSGGPGPAGDAPGRTVVSVAEPLQGQGDAEADAFVGAMATLLEVGATSPRLRRVDSTAFILDRWFRVGDGEVTIARDALFAVADLAGLRAEQQSDARDRHGRVPASVNALVRCDLARMPVVALAGYALRQAVRLAAGRRPFRTVAPWPEGRRWAVSLTHDLDVVDHWPAFTALRLAELARKGRAADVGRVVLHALRPTRGGHVLAAARHMIAAERARSLRSTWYVLAAPPTWRGMTAGDVTYRLNGARAGRILAAARAAQAEVGLHGSFGTYDSAERFAEERAAVARVTGTPPLGVRQHYLRFLPGRTQRAMQEAGFSYDASVGFADRNGFRAGLGDVLPAWDERAQVALAFDLVPFMWMDRALSKYAGIESPTAWVDDALALAGHVRATEGLWSGLWHPNLVPALGYPGSPAAYERLLDGLLEERPFSAPNAELLAWRRRRRSVRAIGIHPNGTVACTADPDAGTSFPIVLEDETGRSAGNAVSSSGAVS